jgi:peptide/nickel transport system permease protein
MSSAAGRSPGRYVIRRCLLAASTLLGVSVLTFVLLHLAPGDRAEVVARRNTSNAAPTAAEIAQTRKTLGLDRALPVQYERWLLHALHGDLGTSDVTRRPVRTEIAYRFPYTLRLALPAALLALVVSIPAGIISAMYRNGAVDQVLRIAAVAGASVPSFWLGLILINVLAVHLRIVPAAGTGGPRNLILPVVTLAAGPAALLMRVTRASVVEALGESYVRTATAKGLARDLVIERHVFPNCLVSLLTVFGNLVGRLLVGAVIVETIFAWPGVGMLLLNSINQQDYPVVVGVVLLAGVVFVTLNLAVDLAYGMIDPRIDVGGRPMTAS